MLKLLYQGTIDESKVKKPKVVRVKASPRRKREVALVAKEVLEVRA
jgi:hypothetical protein